MAHILSLSMGRWCERPNCAGEGKGELRVPRLCDIEGSIAWWNKCDNGLIVTRKQGANEARVISAKVRELGAGRLGECYFMVDPSTGVFVPQFGGVTL